MHSLRVPSRPLGSPFGLETGCGSLVFISFILGNRSQVQGSTLRAKKGIEDPKFLAKMLIFPDNCQFCAKFWVRPDEADVFS